MQGNLKQKTQLFGNALFIKKSDLKSIFNSKYVWINEKIFFKEPNL